MPSPAFDIASPFPEFTHGERMVGISASMATPATSTFCFARRIALEPGRYTVVIVGTPAASFWVGSDALSMRMVVTNACDGYVETDPRKTFASSEEFDLYPGNTRFDVYLQNFNGAARTAGFVLSLYRQGTLVYTSNKTDWLYAGEAPVPDADLRGLPDLRRTLPVWSLFPNWQSGMLERLAWLTNIIPGELASEQRRSLRLLPRRTLEVSFLRTKTHRARLGNFLAGMGTRPFLLPLWFEQYGLPAPLAPSAAGVTFPRNTLGLREFRDGDLVLITNKNPDVFDVAIINKADIKTDTITWEIKPTRTWPKGARLVPLRRAQVLDAPTLDNLTDGVGRTSVLFSLIDPDPGFSPSWGGCSPLFRLKPNWQESVPHTFERVVTTLDNQIAAPSVVDISDQSRITQRMNFTLLGREQVNEFRAFLAMARGRSTRFYLQTFTDDITPTGNISGLAFEAQPSQFYESMLTRQFARSKIGIFFNDGAPTLYRDVVSIEPVGLSTSPTLMNAERYSVDVPLPPITRSRIARISWIATVRFDQDGFELQHDVDDSRVVRAALVMRSIDPLNMPPIDCYATSWTYPQEFIENMQAAASLPAGKLYKSSIEYREGMTTTATPSGGELRPALLNYQIPPERMNTTGVLLAGTLIPVVYRTYPMKSEMMNTSAALQSGLLKSALITYTMRPEMMTAVATIQGGSLYV